MVRGRVEKTIKRKPVERPKKIMKAVGRPKKLCPWSDEQMRRALEAVMNSELGVNRSAIHCGMPKITMMDRISGRVQHGTKPRHVAHLTHTEEEELVNFLFEKKQEREQKKLLRQEEQRKKQEEKAA